MDNLKEEGQSIIILTIILAILVVILAFGLVYLIRSPKDVEENKISQEFAESQEKMENSANEKYKKFAENLKNEVSKLNNDTNFQRVSGEQIKSYSVKLSSNGNISVHFDDEEIEQKYGTDSLVEKVIAFNIVEEGNDGLHTLYFINEDGTVGLANIEVAVGANEDLKIENKIGNLKNIVAITSGARDSEDGNVPMPLFIDINGKVNFKF